MVCHYWCFNHGFKFQKSACNSCHDLLMLCLNIVNISNITMKGAEYYYCIIYDFSKSDAIHLLENSVLDNHGYT